MISFIGFILLTFVISYKFEENIIKILPISLAIFTNIIFILAMFRRLLWIDHIGGIISIIIIVYFIHQIYSKIFDWNLLKYLITEPSFIALAMSFLIVFSLEKGRIACNWDELGCWALEVKTLFLIDGFSLPQMHTIIEYAHYMPGQMIFEWWFCHLNPTYFHEGLMYVGYYLFFVIIMSPIFYFKTSSKKQMPVLKGILGTFILLALPSTVSIFEYGMLSVEFLQSALVGVMLYEIYNYSFLNSHLALWRWLAYSYLLIILKDSSLLLLFIIYMWALFLWIFTKHKFGIPIKNLVIGSSMSAIVVYIWKIYVQINNRGKMYPKATNFIELLFQFLKNPSGADGQTLGYIKAFGEAILYYPLHINRTWGINLTVIEIVCFIATAIYIIYRLHIYDFGKKELLITESFSVIGIAVYLLMVLGMHMFYFRETQYLDAYYVMHSISRYVEPLFLGILLFLLLTCFLKMKWKSWLITICMIILSANLSTVKNCLITYQPAKKSVLSQRKELIEKKRDFFDAINGELEEKEQGRILYVCDNTGDFNIRIFRYMLAPKAIYFLECNQIEKTNIRDTLLKLCETNSIDYIYFDHIDPIYVGHLNIMNNYLYRRKELAKSLVAGE